MDRHDLRTPLLAIALVLAGAGAAGAEPAQAADAPPAAAASAPSRAGSPRPYQAPIVVPSAAGQIRVPTLPAPTITVRPVPPPTFTGRCDSAGCWNSDGTRANAIGGALVRPDGRVCQDVGGVLQCP
ncbi:hypothetical protein O4H66_22975 [Comamonadaceae bacterium G21597-S1]|nr:hypothetical protein [Comamonadaceae bacterium G21597-S1]